MLRDMGFTHATGIDSGAEAARCCKQKGPGAARRRVPDQLGWLNWILLQLFRFDVSTPRKIKPPFGISALVLATPALA